MAQLYEDGATLKEIAAQYGVTLQNVHYQLRAAGVKGRVNDGANLTNPAARAKSRANHPRGTSHPGYRTLPIDELLRTYRDGLSLETLAASYNVSTSTIVRRLRSEGVALRPQGFDGTRRTAADGHHMDSSWEVLVDDWLSERGIPHLVHPLLPFGRRQQSDFLAQGHYVEIWGMAGSLTYDARRTLKVANYERFGLQLIQLWPATLKRGDLTALQPIIDTD